MSDGERATGEVAVAWIKGYATQEHVDWGIATPEQLVRNDRADGLATVAMEVHCTDELHTVRRAKERVALTVAVQRYMLDIAQRQVEQQGAERAPSRPGRNS